MILSTFWEGPPIPGYLCLCISTWKQQVRNVEWRNVNWGNWDELLEDEVPIETLKRAGFAQQADTVKAFALLKWKGIALDLDTIVAPLPDDATRSFFDRESGDTRLKLFGVADKGGVHIAAMSVGEDVGKVIPELGRRVRAVLTDEPHRLGEWNVLGPLHLHHLRASEEYVEGFDVLDRRGVILEERLTKPDPKAIHGCYQSVYFGEQFKDMDPDEFMSISPYRMALLHNSWTPEWFKHLSVEEVLKTDTLMAKLLSRFGDKDLALDIEGRGLRDGYSFS